MSRPPPRLSGSHIKVETHILLFFPKTAECCGAAAIDIRHRSIAPGRPGPD